MTDLSPAARAVLAATDPIRATLERMTAMASDELDTTEEWAHSRSTWDKVIAAARAALAAASSDGPAVPNGREPASVVDQPMSPPDWRGLCEELLEALDGWHQAVFETGVSWVRPDETYLLDRARTALAQAEPEVVGPTRRQLMLLADDMDMASVSDAAEYARAVLARWGNYPVKPDSSAPAPAGGEVDGPSLEEVEELCEEHCFNVEGYESIECLQGLINDALARYGRPASAPAGEVAELVAWLRANALTVQKASGNPANGAKQRMSRAADLLELQAAPVPVAVSERLPGPEDCDAEGRVWGTAELGGWRLVHHSKIGLWRAWLPAHALPLPSGEVEP